MKVYKYSIITAIVLSAISLFMSIRFVILDKEFFKNIFMGIFSSVIVFLMTSIVGYLTVKKDALTNFEYEAYEIIKLFETTMSSNNLHAQLDSLLQIGKYNIINFNKTYTDICFFCSVDGFKLPKKQSEINELYNRILDMKKNISNKSNELQNVILEDESMFEKEMKEYMGYYITNIKSITDFYKNRFGFVKLK